MHNVTAGFIISALKTMACSRIIQNSGLWSLDLVKKHYKFRDSDLNQSRFLAISSREDGISAPHNIGWFFHSIIPHQQRTSYRNMKKIYAHINPEAASSGHPNPWNKWILGMLFTVILPFLKHKWGPLLRLTREIETTLETAEQVTEVVGKVAEEVDKLAEEVEDRLPAAGKLRDAVDFVENMAEETAEAAHRAEDAINKAEEVLEEVDSLLEPAAGKFNKIVNEANVEKKLK